MSRTDRQYHLLAMQPRRRPKQLSLKEINELLRKQFRRDMLAAGLVEPEEKRPVLWRYPVALGKTATVKALTKSEARALIKERLGLDRLPPGFQVERADGN